jgi:hypothetical protein
MKAINYITIFMKITVLLTIMVIVINSCETIEGEPVYMGKEYFPLETGSWVTYQVDSTVWDDFLGEVFDYSYKVKEVQKEIFTDSQGHPKMRVERFIMHDQQSNWQIKNVWTTALHSNRAIKTEENVTFVKLSFPVKPNMSWNGNLLNTGADQFYKITSLHEPYQLLDMEFDSTLTVLQRDFTTLIGKEEQFEVYATGIGLIHKKFIRLETEIDGNIIRGVDYSYNLVDYGSDEQ